MPRWIPIIVGLGLGLIVAYLITDGQWHYAIPLVFAVPAVIVFNRYPFIAILMWILVVPFFLNAQNSADRFIFWMFHRGLIPGSLLVVILSDWLKTNNRPLGKVGRAELAALIFVSLTILNIFLFAPSVRRTLIQSYDLIFVPFTMYWLIRLINPTAEDLKRLMWVALFIVLFQSILGMLSWFSPASVPEQWRSRVEGERTVGTLKNVAVYTSTLLLFSLLLLQYGVTHRSGWIRYGSLVMFGLAEFCVFLSFSRASWVGGIAVMVAALILYPKVVSRLVIIGALLAYIFAGALLADELRFAVERLSGDEALNSAESRVITNNASILMFQEKPTLGWGFKNYDRFDRQFQVRVGDLAVTNDGTS
ncbi:MAG: O-antigen ligase family protein, partial [Anaerolineae bacterium]|nr:O-antigen ligase family protein [Anaerolineae bacterium]